LLISIAANHIIR